jgi:hypothetical protein
MTPRPLPRRAIGLAVTLSALCLGPGRAARAETAQVRDDGQWKHVQVRRPEDLAGFRPVANVGYSRYGGLAGKRFKATGFFRTACDGGRWWLVTPDGYLFLSVGLCSVNLSCFDGPGVYGSEAAWAEATAALLREHGFNTLGRWSAADRFRALGRPMVYCTSLGFMGSYRHKRPQANGARGFPHETMPVFDPEWPAFCKRYAERVARTKEDPWLLGHFSDNELPFRPDALDNYLALPASDPGHRAALRFLASRGKTPRTATGADSDAFCTLVAERYYTAVADAIRLHDPNHLYLGSRIHGRCIRGPTFRGAQAVDVVSVNYYHRWSPEPDRLAEWVRLSGRPVLVSEWYAMAPGEGEDVSGAGFRVRTQRDRGLFYQHFAVGLLQHRGCVGWHWFKYGSRHKGIVTETFEPRRAVLDLMKELNRQVYPLALFFQDRRRSPTGCSNNRRQLRSPNRSHLAPFRDRGRRGV